MSRLLVSFVSFCHNTHATMSSTLGYDVPNTSILRSSSACLVPPCLGAMEACWNLDSLELESDFCKYLSSIQCQHLTNNPSSIEIISLWNLQYSGSNFPTPKPKNRCKVHGSVPLPTMCHGTTTHGGQGKLELGSCKHPNLVQCQHLTPNWPLKFHWIFFEWNLQYFGSSLPTPKPSNLCEVHGLVPLLTMFCGFNKRVRSKVWLITFHVIDTHHGELLHYVQGPYDLSWQIFGSNVAFEILCDFS